MTILAVLAGTHADAAVLAAAATEAQLRADDLVVVPVGDGQSDGLTAEDVRAQLQELNEGLDDPGIDISIGHSALKDPADAVVQVSQQQDAQLIVLGIRRRSPVGKLLLGSRTQRILLEATCPVLAVPA